MTSGNHNWLTRLPDRSPAKEDSIEKRSDGQILFCLLEAGNKKSERTICSPLRDGGGGGNRTPVRKRFNRTYSGRRRLFAFPRPGANRHAQGLGSFMIHGALKALRTHGHHLSTPRPGPWSSRAGRSLLRQREEQRFRRSLIYKLPVLWMPGASARYFCLYTPVETVTSPYQPPSGKGQIPA